MPKLGTRYWDAGPFLAWLKNEQRDDRARRCESVIRPAERGELVIVTSSISLVEVVRLDQRGGVVNVGPEAAAAIDAFFRQPYISIRVVDVRIGELARDLIWRFGLSTRDALHLATALRYGITQVDTFDGGLLGLDGKVGSPPLRITRS